MIPAINAVTVAQMMGVRLSHVETPKAEEWTPSASFEWAKHMDLHDSAGVKVTHYEGRMQNLGRRLDNAIKEGMGIITLKMNNFTVDFPTRMNATKDLQNIRQELPVSGDEIAKLLRG